MADLITAVTRLLADPRELVLFEEDPSLSAQRLGVEDPDTGNFCALNVSELRWQADCLVDKRGHEARNFLPRTFAVLGGRAKSLFTQYAATHWPNGHRRHFEDAWRFTLFLQEKGVTDRDYAECHRLQFEAGSTNYSVRWLPSYLVRGQRRRALQLLWRRNGEISQRAFFFAAR